MQTLMLTMPELEQAARQWAVDFLSEKWEGVAVVTDLRRVLDARCEDRKIILFQRAPAALLRHVLQSGGRPWLVSDIIGCGAPRMRYTT
ncbi:MAG: hypothetical protein WA864_12765 [Acetobacteraceae bacterium]|jgi:hypothetical protein